jgi:plasmid stabilization system protein ParE
LFLSFKTDFLGYTFYGALIVSDLLEIVRYIRIDSPANARRVRDEIKKKVSRLETFPQSGRLVPELPGSGNREIIVRKYRVIYRVKPKVGEIEIPAVRHGAKPLELDPE